MIGYYAAVGYLCRRLGQALLVLFAVSALPLALAETAPGSLVDELRRNPRISPATIEAMRDRYGPDESFLEKYLHRLQSIWRRDPNSKMGGWLWSGGTQLWHIDQRHRGLGNFRPTVFDHHALGNADELSWRRGPPGARR